MENETENQVGIVRQEESRLPLSAAQIRHQVNLIQEVMQTVMQDGHHYGKIPGCGDKPTLLKPGAEKLCMTFRLRPIISQTDIIISELGEGHREVRVFCHILNMAGEELATGIGSCSTMEKKYRYRKDPKGNRIENPDLADTFNTVLKIAKKRGFVDGILSATAASDIFTQDLEDIVDAEPKPAIKPPQAKLTTENGKVPDNPLTDKGNPISDPQRKRLWAILKSKESLKTEDDLRAYLSEHYGVTRTEEIQRETYEEICDWILGKGAGNGNA